MLYKWAQLDLARQMETMEFIKEFMGTMAKAGYNGILLYLEDRIRTASYPYPADDECYTPEQVKELLAYAETLHIEIVPCVATLGHAERFLAHPELEHLSELQGDMKGRFGWTKKQTFCPTHPDFYPFLTKYLQEVAALFPTKFFHAGLDEFWDYCLCDRCKAAAPDYQAQEALFVKHVQIVDDCLKSCGKRMMMWSDMFEYYPEAQEKIPRDIIMCDWQYQEDVREYVHHLFDVKVEDRLALNEKLGFESFLAPVDMLYRNAESYLDYAENRKFTGCILTSWEKSDTFLYRTIPTYCYAGYLMSGLAPEEATNAMMEQLFGTQDTILTSAITLALEEGPWRHFASISNTMLFSRDFQGMPYKDFEADFSARRIIQAQAKVVKTPLGERIIQDLLAALEEKCISHELKRYFHAVLDGHQANEQRFQALRKQFVQYLALSEEHWKLWRPTIQGNYFTVHREALLKQLDEAHKTLVSSKFVKLRCCVPDGYTVEHIRTSLKFDKVDQWVQIADSIYKPQELRSDLCEAFIPYQSEKAPVAIKLEAYGMGGVGICFVQTEGFVPKTITEVSGIVQTPEHLLHNNVNFAWFGSQSTAEAYFNQKMADQVHSVILE